MIDFTDRLLDQKREPVTELDQHVRKVIFSDQGRADYHQLVKLLSDQKRISKVPRFKARYDELSEQRDTLLNNLRDVAVSLEIPEDGLDEVMAALRRHAHKEVAVMNMDLHA